MSAIDEGMDAFLMKLVDEDRGDEVRLTSQRTLALGKANASCLIQGDSPGNRHDDTVRWVTLGSGAIVRQGDWLFRIAGPKRDTRRLTELILAGLSSWRGKDRGGPLS
jgi:hypothetical protein